MPDINFPTFSGLPPTSSLARSVQPPRAARDLGRPTNPRDQVSMLCQCMKVERWLGWFNNKHDIFVFSIWTVFLKFPLNTWSLQKLKNSRPTHIPGSSFDRLFGAPPPRPTRPQQLTLVRAFWKLKSGFNLTQKIEFKRSCGFQFDEAEIWLYSNLCGATWYQEIAAIHFRQKIDKSFSWCKTHAILKMKLCSKS